MSTDLFIFLREEAAGIKDDFFCEVAKEVRILKNIPLRYPGPSSERFPCLSYEEYSILKIP